SNNQKQKDKEVASPTVFCDHCKKPWHTKAQCWFLNGGKPADWKPRSERLAERRAQNPRANAASNSTTGDENQFSKGQLEALKKMFSEVLQTGQSSNSSPADFFTGSFAQGGGIREDDWDC
ncbi:hypothetical protein LINPERHAP2_LOCUS39643, partial [Linum perenne]